MRVVTIRSQVRGVSDRWNQQYSSLGSDAQAEIGRQLREIDTETATAAEIAAIIGNNSWVGPSRCHECKRFFHAVVEVGEEPDYESNTANLCVECLRRALAALEAK